MQRMKKAVLLAISIVMLAVFTGCGKTAVKLNDYIVITSEGYDSLGTASYTFDSSKFIKDYSKKIKTSKSGSSELGYYPGWAPAELLLDFCVNHHLDKSSNLSNGDEITLEWDCEDALAEELFNVKLKYSDIKHTVNNLEKVSSFDPFNYVVVEYTGTAPNGTANLIKNYDREEMQYVDFTIDKKSGLNNGDVITVTAKIHGYVDSFVEKYGTVLNPAEKQYTVYGLESYVLSFDSVSEEALERMRSQAEDDYSSYMAKTWNDKEKLHALTYVGNYFLTLKDGWTGNNNYIYLVYKCDVSSDGLPLSYYYFRKFQNLKLSSDGECIVDLTKGETPSNKVYNENKYYYHGYATLEELFKDCVQSQLSWYTYENNVEE